MNLSLHNFSEKEYKKDTKFRKKHYKKCNNPNRFIYELIGSGIGTSIKIKCPICKKEKDLTDIDNW